MTVSAGNVSLFQDVSCSLEQMLACAYLSCLSTSAPSISNAAKDAMAAGKWLDDCSTAALFPDFVAQGEMATPLPSHMHFDYDDPLSC